MSARNGIRQFHRWVSMAFTLTVIANFVALGLGKGAQPPAWITSAPLLPLALLLEDLRFEPGAAFFGSLLYQAGPVSIGTTLMMLWLVRHGGAERASSFHLLNPFFSIALAAALLGETMGAADLLALIPLVGGMALALPRPAAR